MKRLLLTFVATVALFSACGGSEKQTKEECAATRAGTWQEFIKMSEEEGGITGTQLDVLIIETSEDLKNILVEECGYSRSEVEELLPSP